MNMIGSNNPAWKGGKIKKVCVKCKKNFSVYPYRCDAKFCSRRCSNGVTLNRKGIRTGKTFFCQKCGNVFYRYPCSIGLGITKFCSSKCWGLFLAEKFIDKSKHPCWQGGKTKLLTQLRHSKNYIEWRIAVFTRDNYTCQICGQFGGRIEADHIKPFAYFPDLRFVIGNGRTLCKSCHSKTDTYLRHLGKEGEVV